MACRCRPRPDAIGKQAIGLFGANGALQGQPVARGGALLIGAHHRDAVAPAGGLMGQRFDAFGKDPVVIADQDLEGGSHRKAILPHAR